MPPAGAKPPQKEAPTPGPEKEQRLPVHTNKTPSTADEPTPKRQASMRLVEQGKNFIDAGEYERAATVLRDAISVDSGNGVAYYYLSLAEARLGQTDVALGVLDKAEALLGADTEWMGKIVELRSELGAPVPAQPVVAPIDVTF